ncbi:hypothetical protein TcasGA2_TC010220 [Tribolium castaneum]|uniref:Uncharacterized protein n=1 Tax=Tribolium castaneum TaxID=7070 RepID=D6WTP9_TRICA|nr:hypothetical protein TcasGA2_TC010220 [Tribolium castaneum]
MTTLIWGCEIVNNALLIFTSGSKGEEFEFVVNAGSSDEEVFDVSSSEDDKDPYKLSAPTDPSPQLHFKIWELLLWNNLPSAVKWESPPLTLEAIMGAMKTLLAPINERLQRLEEAVFSDKASEAGSTSTFTGFSAHSLKSGESQDFMETEGFSPVKTGKKRGAPSPSPVDNEIDTGNRFSNLSNEDDFEPTPSDVENGEEREMEERRKKKKSSSPKPSPRIATWASVAAAPKCSTSAAPKYSNPAAPRISIPAAPRVSPPTAPQGSTPTAPILKAPRIPPIFLRDARKWQRVSSVANKRKYGFTKRGA